MRSYPQHFLYIRVAAVAIFVVAAFIVPERADAAAAFVQSTTAYRTSLGTATTTNAITTTSGNTFIATASYECLIDATVTITDSRTNTWTRAIPKDRSGGTPAVCTDTYYVTNATGGASHTFTATVDGAGVPELRLHVHEVSGILTASPVDKYATSTNDQGTTVSVGPVTPTENGEYVYGYIVITDPVSDTITADSPFTTRGTTNPTSKKSNSADYVQATAASISQAWTITNGTTYASARMITFKAAAGDAPADTPTALKKPPNNLGLVGFWSFNEGVGTVAGDSSGNGYSGTLGSGVTWATGKRGNAISDDGSSSVTVNNSSGLADNLTNMTVSIWFNTTTSLDAFLITKISDVSSTAGWFANVVASNGHVQFGIQDVSVGNAKETVAAYNDGRWHHFVGTVSGGGAGTVTIYIDGQAVSTTVSQGGTPGSISNAENIRIGAQGTGNYFGGKLDEARIYNRALSASEIVKLYQSGFVKIGASSVELQRGSSLASGLVGHWTFDGADITANQVVDRSGQGNHGGFFGGATSSAKTIGVLGQALNFDKIDDFVNVGGAASLQLTGAMTICAWAKADTISASYEAGFVAKVSTGNEIQYALFANDVGGGNLVSFKWTSDGVGAEEEYYTAGGVFEVGTWFHICAARNAALNDVDMYINGTDVSVTPNGASAVTTQVSNASIGRYGDTDNHYWDGALDDVRIYNRALSATEVKQLYSLGQTKIR